MASILLNPSRTPFKVPSLDGKVILLTGGTAGLGKHAAEAVLRGKPRLLVLLGRNAEKGQTAIDDLKLIHPKANIEFLECDLFNLDSVRKAAKEFLNKDIALDILINNAGVMMPEHKKSPEGYEVQLATNVLGPFLLTQLLIPRMIESAPARIVWVASRAEALGVINWDDVGCRRVNTSGPWQYCVSKLYTLMIAREMAKRLQDKGVTVVAAHPGVAYTEMPDKIHYFGAPARWIGKAVALVYGQGPARGATSQVMAAVSDDVKPGYFYGPDVLNLHNTHSCWFVNPHAFRSKDTARLYDACLDLVGLKLDAASGKLNQAAKTSTDAIKDGLGAVQQGVH